MRTLQDFAKPDSGGQRLPNTTPTVNAATSEQIHTLLHICASLSPLLIGDDEDADTNARDSACATYVNATTRLDKILAEDHRWGVAEYDEVVKNLNLMYKKQSQYMEASSKRDAAETKRSLALALPHNMRRVSLYALNNGQWCACDGDIQLKSSLKALGDTPEEAVGAFDRIWNGQEPYQPFSVGGQDNADKASGETEK